MANEFIPRSDARRLVFAQIFTAELPGVAAQVGISPAQVSDLQSKNAAARQAYTQHQTQKALLRAAKTAKNQAIAALVETIRAIARLVRASPDVTDEILARLGMPVPDRTPTPRRLSLEDRAYITRLIQTPTEHKFYFSNEATPDSRAAPVAAVGAVIYLKVGGDRPAGKSGMRMVGFVTSAPFSFRFEPEDVGKTAWWVAAWTDGDSESTASEPYSATVTG